MYAVIEYPIALFGSSCSGLRSVVKTRGSRFPRLSWDVDPEGNSARAHGRAIKQSVLLATGIAGAIILPAILAGIAKIIAAAAGT